MPLADPNHLETGCHLGSNLEYPWTEWRHALPISGDYIDQSGQNHMINAYQWLIETDLFQVSQTDLLQRIVIAKNDASNVIAPNKWSKLQWARSSSLDLFFCHSVNNAVSEQDAIYLPSADPDNLETGCLNGPWGALTPD